MAFITKHSEVFIMHFSSTHTFAIVIPYTYRHNTSFLNFCYYFGRTSRESWYLSDIPWTNMSKIIRGQILGEFITQNKQLFVSKNYFRPKESNIWLFAMRYVIAGVMIAVYQN